MSDQRRKKSLLQKPVFSTEGTEKDILGSFISLSGMPV